MDFYTGLIYKAMGFPEKMFTVLFAIGRLPGWIAQWREMISDPNTKIGRPRQLYIGEPERNYPSVYRPRLTQQTTPAAHLSQGGRPASLFGGSPARPCRIRQAGKLRPVWPAAVRAHPC